MAELPKSGLEQLDVRSVGGGDRCEGDVVHKGDREGGGIALVEGSHLRDKQEG